MPKNIAALCNLQNLLFPVVTGLIKLHFPGLDTVEPDNRVSFIKNNLFPFVVIACFTLLQKLEALFGKVGKYPRFKRVTQTTTLRTLAANWYFNSLCGFFFCCPREHQGRNPFYCLYRR